MNKEMIREKVKCIFDENGVFIFSGEEDVSLELDSLRFISLIVAVENAFDVEIPDKYLSQEMLVSYNDFCDLITMLC